jgi:hypothetical protein
MKKNLYPIYEKETSKLIHSYLHPKKETVTFFFTGGDLWSRDDVIKLNDIEDSIKIIYPYLDKATKSKKKFEHFFWAIDYSVPELEQLKGANEKREYKINRINYHCLVPLCTDENDSSKLNVSSDLFVSKESSNLRDPYGKQIESVIMVTKLLKNLKEVNFKKGFLYNVGNYGGWLKSNSSQSYYIREKLKNAWADFKIDIKKPKKFSELKIFCALLQKEMMTKGINHNLDTKKSIRHAIKKGESYLKSKVYGEDLEVLIYLRNEINPKIKFTFARLDKAERKILKKFSII